MSENQSLIEVKKGSAKSFGYVITVFLVILTSIDFYKDQTINYGLASAAAILMLITLIRPQILEPFNALWFKLGLFLGAVVAPLVMGSIFYLIFTPFGLIVRLFGKDSLRLRRKPNSHSYWLSRDKDKWPMGSLKNQF